MTLVMCFPVCLNLTGLGCYTWELGSINTLMRKLFLSQARGVLSSHVAFGMKAKCKADGPGDARCVSRIVVSH